MMKQGTAAFMAIVTAALLLAPPLSAQRKGAGDRGPADEFLIISSIAAGKNQLLLKRPREVTDVMRVGGNTRCFDGNGKQIALTDPRAAEPVSFPERVVPEPSRSKSAKAR